MERVLPYDRTGKDCVPDRSQIDQSNGCSGNLAGAIAMLGQNGSWNIVFPTILSWIINFSINYLNA